jgi:hypothetical protein
MKIPANKALAGLLCSLSSNFSNHGLSELVQLSQSRADLAGCQARIRNNLHHFQAVDHPNGDWGCNPCLSVYIGKFLCHLAFPFVQMEGKRQCKLPEMLPFLSSNGSGGGNQSATRSNNSTENSSGGGNGGDKSNITHIIVTAVVIFLLRWAAMQSAYEQDSNSRIKNQIQAGVYYENARILPNVNARKTMAAPLISPNQNAFFATKAVRFPLLSVSSSLHQTSCAIVSSAVK